MTLSTWLRAPVPRDRAPLHERVVAVLRGSGPKTRDQLVTALGMPRTTIHDAIHLLERRGLVRRYPEPLRRGRGRPRVLFAVT